MTEPLDWRDLARFKREGRFLEGYPGDVVTFFSPRDDVAGVIRAVLAPATHSIVIGMYGYADAGLDEVVRSKLTDEQVYVQVSLDSSQAGGKTAKAILTKWANDGIGNSIALGRSAGGGISHLKMCVVDGLYTIRGSTNWSKGGQTEQDNELTVTRDPVLAAESRAVLDVVHDGMLKQMAKKREAGA